MTSVTIHGYVEVGRKHLGAGRTRINDERYNDPTTPIRRLTIEIDSDGAVALPHDPPMTNLTTPPARLEEMVNTIEKLG